MATTLADMLREESKNNLLKDIEWLPEEVAKDIRNCGRFIIICDTHIHDISKTRSSIPYKYDHAVREWARQQGFNVYSKCNSYGVKQIAIEL